MLPFEGQFRRLGGDVGAATGGAAGGGLAGALGQMLAPLDYPRQALWNLGGGVAQGLGSGDWTQALKAIPGALGVAAGGLATPFVGLPGGVSVGSAVGGLAQHIGKQFGGEMFDAPEVSDLTGTDDMLPNFLVGMATDPLTYAGGLGGAMKGRQLGAKAGGEFGAGLSAEAMARGPRYPTTPAIVDQWVQDPKFLKSLGVNQGLIPAEGFGSFDALLNNPAVQQHLAMTGGGRGLEHIQAMLANPSVFGELHPQSAFGGKGAESMFFKHPEGGGTLMRRPSEEITQALGVEGVPTRPALAEMLQAPRSAMYDSPLAPIRVERVPHADIAGAIDPATRQAFAKTEVPRMEAGLLERGLNPQDVHGGNWGVSRTAGGGPLVTDPGAIFPGSSALPLTAETPAPTGGWLKNKLLDMLGGDEAVRRELVQQTTDPAVYREMAQQLVAHPAGSLPLKPGTGADAMWQQLMEMRARDMAPTNPLRGSPRNFEGRNPLNPAGPLPPNLSGLERPSVAELRRRGLAL